MSGLPKTPWPFSEDEDQDFLYDTWYHQSVQDLFPYSPSPVFIKTEKGWKYKERIPDADRKGRDAQTHWHNQVQEDWYSRKGRSSLHVINPEYINSNCSYRGIYRLVLVDLEQRALSPYHSPRRTLVAPSVHEYVADYHSERNHQGKSNVLLFPPITETRGERAVRCRERLGGLLRYYPPGRRVNSRVRR
jgi:hypothetical protein